jgi:hypothetical protein
MRNGKTPLILFVCILKLLADLKKNLNPNARTDICRKAMIPHGLLLLLACLPHLLHALPRQVII